MPSPIGHQSNEIRRPARGGALKSKSKDQRRTNSRYTARPQARLIDAAGRWLAPRRPR